MNIEPLTKVTLSVQTESLEGHKQDSGRTITFIYGIGTAGLADFELALARNPEEETVRIQLKPSVAPIFFGHLYGLFRDWLPTGYEIALTFRLQSSEAASSREVVKSMAGGQECGCGCGCGDACHT